MLRLAGFARISARSRPTGSFPQIDTSRRGFFCPLIDGRCVMTTLRMPVNRRYLILDPEERRQVQSRYLPWLGLDLLVGRNETFRTEFGVAMLPSGHVGVATDSHAIEVRCKEDCARFGFRLIQDGVTQVLSAANRQVEALAGQCLVSRHHEGQRLKFTPGHRSVFTIDEAAIRNFVRHHYDVEAPSDLQFGEVFRFDDGPLADLLPLIDTIIDSSACGEPRPQGVTQSWQNVLIAYVVEHIPHNFMPQLRRAETAVVHRCARRARDFIHANLENRITLTDMAGAARCSPRQLQLTFRSCFGTTPMAMLRKLRLEAAATRLAKGDCQSVTDAALSVGYSNLGRFARDFRRQFGSRPSEAARFQTKRKS
jgi:AraC-like DNA-binding protein